MYGSSTESTRLPSTLGTEGFGPCSFVVGNRLATDRRVRKRNRERGERLEAKRPGSSGPLATGCLPEENPQATRFEGLPSAVARLRGHHRPEAHAAFV